MGLVFEAVRDDDEYRKTVALKIAPPWTNAAAVRERFRLERQILAELEHPNIARFLDGGTESGVPYFVMEYVEGSRSRRSVNGTPSICARASSCSGRSAPLCTSRTRS